MWTADMITPHGNKRVTSHLTSLLYRSSRMPKGVHRKRTSRTSRSKPRRPGIKARSTNGLFQLLLLHAVGGHGAIKNRVVELMVGMVVG